ncbi:protein LURP-one-related 10-like [Triticum urartu]|nr:protein LURP-one-related 10-like [Triticum urartu]
MGVKCWGNVDHRSSTVPCFPLTSLPFPVPFDKTRQARAPNPSPSEQADTTCPAPPCPDCRPQSPRSSEAPPRTARKRHLSHRIDGDGRRAPAGAAAVVGHQFFAPYVVPLTVTKKALSLSDGDFAITDANGAVVLKVKGAIFSIRSRRTILDGAGMPLLTMQEKVFSMHHRWEVFRGDSTSSGDLLFSVKTTSLIQLKTEMDVFLAGNTAQQVCDFKIKGSYFDRSCVFYLGDSNNMVAQMSRKLTVSNVLLGRDTFSVTVFPHVDYVFIASLVVILDEVHRDKRED